MPATEQLTIERFLTARREVVFEAWTDCRHYRHWMSPKGFSVPACEIDFRVGGTYLNCMRSPEGDDFWSTGTYREIVPPERIVSTDSFADEEGNLVPATYYGMGEDIPLEMLVTVTFEEQDDGTRLTIRHEGFPPGEHFESASQGWNECLDKLEDYLADFE